MVVVCDNYEIEQEYIVINNFNEICMNIDRNKIQLLMVILGVKI